MTFPADVIKITNTEAFEHGTTEYDGLLDVSYDINPQFVEFTGDGTRKGQDQDKIGDDISVQLTFEDDAAAMRLLSATEANGIVTFRQKGGTLATRTFKNLRIDKAGARWPTAASQQPGTSTVNGRLIWGPSDTLATMITNGTVGS